MGRRTGKLSDEARWEDWRRWILRSTEEVRWQEDRDRVYAALCAIFDFRDGALLRNGRPFFEWCMFNYIDATLLYIRRELDTQVNGEALRQILSEMIGHPRTVTRARWMVAWSRLPAPPESGIVHLKAADVHPRVPERMLDRSFHLIRADGDRAQ